MNKRDEIKKETLGLEIQRLIEKSRQDSPDAWHSETEEVIGSLLKNYPHNKKTCDVLIKICVFNRLLSANVIDVVSMAKHICNLSIDGALKSGDLNLPHKIAAGHGIKNQKKSKERNFYSFATKYCCLHNEDVYPMYDRFVAKMLCEYRRRGAVSKFKNKDLRDYPKYCGVLDELRNKYGLEHYTRREIELALWCYGRKKFGQKH